MNGGIAGRGIARPVARNSRAATSQPRGISCTSSRCRRGKDRCVPPSRPVRRCAGLACIVAARPACRLQLALLLAVELLLQCIDRRRRLARVNPNLARLRIERRSGRAALATGGAFGTARSRPRRCIHRLPIGSKNLHPEQEPDRVFLELQPSSLRTCRRTRACRPPADPAAHSRATRCPLSGDPSRAGGPSTARRSRSASPCARDSASSPRRESSPSPRSAPSASRRSRRPARGGSVPAA